MTKYLVKTLSDEEISHLKSSIGKLSIDSSNENYYLVEALRDIANVIEDTCRVADESLTGVNKYFWRKFLTLFNHLDDAITSIYQNQTAASGPDSSAIAKLINNFYMKSDARETEGGYNICQIIREQCSPAVRGVSAKDLQVAVYKMESDANDIIDRLKLKDEEYNVKLSKQVANAYAKMFKDEAAVIQKFSYGWLGTVVIVIIAFITIIFKEDSWFPLEKSELTIVVTLSYVKRLLIVSFFIYLLTFCIRQYNVKMHIQTLNRHRANTISSYALFIDSLSVSDVQARNEIMKEVAKAIYESRETGYISSKEGTEPSTIISEITKIINPVDK